MQEELWLLLRNGPERHHDELVLGELRPPDDRPQAALERVVGIERSATAIEAAEDGRAARGAGNDVRVGHVGEAVEARVARAHLLVPGDAR